MRLQANFIKFSLVIVKVSESKKLTVPIVHKSSLLRAKSKLILHIKLNAPSTKSSVKLNLMELILRSILGILHLQYRPNIKSKVTPKLATYNLRISGLDIVRLDQELVTERIKRKKPIQIILTSLFIIGLRDLKKFVI